MCEFKIIKKNDGSQIGEDIVILNYTEENKLVFKDILGTSIQLDSALILDVNTLNQTCVVLENPLVKNFVALTKNISNKKVTREEIEDFQAKLDALKNNI